MTVLVAIVASALAAGPALAHVEVTGTPARGGASDAVLTFTAEAESQSGGIASMRVLLPTGIAPADVSYIDGPAGWRLTVAADGFTVGGPALAIGTNAKFRVRLRQLPRVTTLVFKTIETYNNGKVSRWIGEPRSGADNPAPALRLGAPLPAASAPNNASSAPVTATPTATASPRGNTAAPASSEDDAGGGGWRWIALAVALGLATGGVIAAVRRWRESTN